ncbi:MAG: CoA pyrophosphatase, partial [Minwuia sp.]|nr:CoA pyrophosphatase [Minwuia sp.]
MNRNHWQDAHAAGALREHVRDRLDAFERHPPERTRLKEAAVTVIVTENDAGAPVFVLTQRASKMRNHAGQWALPGGRIDAGEDAATAARREIEEEIGITIAEHDLFGPLDAYVTRSGYAITPFVAWAAPGARFTLSPAEVQALHLVPLTDLDRP